MGSHPALRRAGSFALAAGLAISICAFSASRSLSGEAPGVDVSVEFAPGGDGSSNRAPATVFSINAVLAKLDRQGGRASPEGVRLAAFTPSNIATDAPSAPAESLPATGNEPFGLFTFRAPDGLLWRKWRGVESAMAQEKAVLEQCRADAQACPAHAAQFLRLVGAVKSKTGRARLEEANRGINQAIRYVNDLSQHGELDRWSTPLATFATAKGDCEDYAIAKYVALIDAGVARDDLQLVLVRDRLVRQDHAVLAARHDGRWLILDNRWSELTADGAATRFTPLFAINHDGVHLFAAPYAKRTVPSDQKEAAPAAARDVNVASWSGTEFKTQTGSGIGSLPLQL
jgi:predicted transglutaminase-like cysteine proteinase